VPNIVLCKSEEASPNFPDLIPILLVEKIMSICAGGVNYELGIYISRRL